MSISPVLFSNAGSRHIDHMLKHLSSLIFSAAFLSACSGEAPTSGGDFAGCATRAYDNVGGPISLIDHTGAAVTEEDFKGRESLVYFGFTNCPDVCPLSLQKAAMALEQMPDNVEKPRTILISVDPDQDTPEVMAAYVESNGFPEDMVGLTGAPENIRAAADAFMSDYRRVEQPDSTLGYTMDHTSILYLMDKDWKLKTFFTESTPEEMAACIAALAD